MLRFFLKWFGFFGAFWVRWVRTYHGFKEGFPLDYGHYESDPSFVNFFSVKISRIFNFSMIEAFNVQNSSFAA